MMTVLRFIVQPLTLYTGTAEQVYPVRKPVFVLVTASPCMECAKLIIQSGIRRVVYGEKYRLTDGVDLLERAGIEVVYLGE